MNYAFKSASVTLFIFFLLLSVNAQEWQTNIKTAKLLASEEDKKIVLVFQGSDWCAPCMKLDREIWTNKKFQTLAAPHFVMFQADFPRRKKNKLSEKLSQQNNALAAEYNPNGYFPFVVIIDEKGKVLGSAGYEKAKPEEYFKKLKSFTL